MLSIRLKFLVLSGIVALALVVRIVCFVGLVGSDDLTYNHRAYEIMTGTFAPQPDHQASRIGLFLPVAGAFTLFGINEVSSVLFPFVCGLATFGLVLWLGIVGFGWRVGLLAGWLYALLPIDMFQASILLPDIPAAACIAVSATLIYVNTSRHVHRHAWAWMALAGLCFGWAYLIKETSVFFGVFVAGYVGVQWRRHRRFPRSWIWFAIGALLPVGMEFGYYAWTTGTPFFRYVAVQTAHNAPLFSGRHYQGVDLFRRLTIESFYLLFQVTDFSLVAVFALAGSIYSLWQRKSCLRFCVGWFGCLWGLYNFASTSLSGYYPLVFFPRFFVVLSVPAVLICAWFLDEIATCLCTSQNLRHLRIALGISLAPLLIVNIIWFSWVTTGVTSVVGLLIVATYLRWFHQWLQKPHGAVDGRVLVLGALALLMGLPGLVLAVRGERPQKGLTCERDLLPVLESPLQHPVYTDRRTEPILEFFFQYHYEDVILPFHDLDLNTVENAYVIANWERLFFLNTMYHNRIPETLYNPPAYWLGPVQLGGSVNPCLIYLVPDLP